MGDSLRIRKAPIYMIEPNWELGLPLTLDPSQGRFGGMTSSFVIVNFPVLAWHNRLLYFFLLLPVKPAMPVARVNLILVNGTTCRIAFVAALITHIDGITTNALALLIIVWKDWGLGVLASTIGWNPRFNIIFIHLRRSLQNVGDAESLVYLPFRYMNQDSHRQ